MQKILTPLLLLFAGVCLGMMLTRSCQSPVKEPEVKIKRDTLIKVQIDTQYFPKPVPYREEVRDTILLTDTVFLPGQMLLQEVKEYQDSTYYARISGINAFLEEIRVYPRITTKYITQTEYVRERPKKWGIGIQGGYAISGEGFYPYIGIGISYNFIQF